MAHMKVRGEASRMVWLNPKADTSHLSSYAHRLHKREEPRIYDEIKSLRDSNPEYAEALQRHTEDQVDENVSELLFHWQEASRQPGGYVTLYRSIVVPDPDLTKVRLSNPGVYWSFTRKCAYPHMAEGSGYTAILQADVHWKEIDWESSFHLAVAHFHEECEARLFEESRIRIDGYWRNRIWTKRIEDFRTTSESKLDEWLRFVPLKFPVFTPAGVVADPA